MTLDKDSWTKGQSTGSKAKRAWTKRPLSINCSICSGANTYTLDFFGVPPRRTEDQDKSTGIFSLHMVGDLVRRKGNPVTCCYFQFSCKVYSLWRYTQYIGNSLIHPRLQTNQNELVQILFQHFPECTFVFRHSNCSIRIDRKIACVYGSVLIL